jgi:CubicO group peptidase (beta-lactamase class C family)
MKIIAPFKIILTVILLVSFTAISFAQIDKAEAEIAENMKKLSVVGLSVAVVKKGEIIYAKSFGQKDIDSNTPLTNENIFRIASISKSFSATSIMQLVEAGKVSLEDDLSDLVGFKVRNPKFPDTKITLKLAMSHLSSINDREGYSTLDGINPAKNPNWANCYSDYEPGSKYAYCNLNYNMIGTIIERISGERFDQYVKKHVINPLKLYAGYCVDSLDNNKFATIYEYNGKTKQFTASPGAYAPRREEIKNYISGYSSPIFSPTGGMKISATDLAKYMTMHMNLGKYKGVKIISKKSAQIMQTKLSDEEDYGLALKHESKYIDGVNLTGHTGSAYGLYSAMFWDPKEKYGFVVITNGCNPSRTDGTTDILKSTINILYNGFIAK